MEIAKWIFYIKPDIVIDYKGTDSVKYFSGNLFSMSNADFDISEVVYVIYKMKWDSNFFGFPIAFVGSRYLSDNIQLLIEDFVKKNGESALIDLAKIHPDKDLINSDCDKCKSAELDKKVEIKEPKELKETQIVYSNFNGETKSNTDGKEMIDKIKTINTNMVILGAFVLLGVAYLVKK